MSKLWLINTYSMNRTYSQVIRDVSSHSLQVVDKATIMSQGCHQVADWLNLLTCFIYNK